MGDNKVNEINALLPQTQCGDCSYSGCLPYAKAIAAEEAPIDLCLPGGLPTLKSLAHHLDQDPTPMLDAMAQKAKPSQTVVIQEEACIGCTKCIQACPVDAIIGSAKKMHSVIESECTGCGLCIPPCPVDCIVIAAKPAPSTEQQRQAMADLARARYDYRTFRLDRNKREKRERYAKTRAAQLLKSQSKTNDADTVAKRKAEIAAAVARVKRKREQMAKPE